MNSVHYRIRALGVGGASCMFGEPFYGIRPTATIGETVDGIGMDQVAVSCNIPNPFCILAI